MNLDQTLAPLLQPLLQANGNVNALETIRAATLAQETNRVNAIPFMNPYSPFGFPMPQQQVSRNLLYTESASATFPMNALQQQSQLTLSHSMAIPPTTEYPMPFLQMPLNEETKPKQNEQSPNNVKRPEPKRASPMLVKPFSVNPFNANNQASPLCYSALAAQSLAAMSNHLLFRGANAGLKQPEHLQNFNSSNAALAALSYPLLSANAFSLAHGMASSGLFNVEQQKNADQQKNIDHRLNSEFQFNAQHLINAQNALNVQNALNAHNALNAQHQLNGLPLLTPNNPRYQAYLTNMSELNISACDSTKFEYDRKKFSPDSSTTLMRSSIPSPKAPVKPRFSSPNLPQPMQLDNLSPGLDLCMRDCSPCAPIRPVPSKAIPSQQRKHHKLSSKPLIPTPKIENPDVISNSYVGLDLSVCLPTSPLNPQETINTQSPLVSSTKLSTDSSNASASSPELTTATSYMSSGSPFLTTSVSRSSPSFSSPCLVSSVESPNPSFMPSRLPPKKNIASFVQSEQKSLKNGICNEPNLPSQESLYWAPSPKSQNCCIFSAAPTPVRTDSPICKEVVQNAIKACMTDEELDQKPSLKEESINDQKKCFDNDAKRCFGMLSQDMQWCMKQESDDEDTHSDRLVIADVPALSLCFDSDAAKSPCYLAMQKSPRSEEQTLQKPMCLDEKNLEMVEDSKRNFEQTSQLGECYKEPIPKLSIRLKGKKAKGSKKNQSLQEACIIRRHSADEAKQDTSAEHTENEEELGTIRARCTTYPGSAPKNTIKRNKRRGTDAANMDPWTIRRSERIFLHSAYQSNPSEKKPLNLIITSNRKLVKDRASREQQHTYSESMAKSMKHPKQANKEKQDFLSSIAWHFEKMAKPNDFLLQEQLTAGTRVLLRHEDLLYAGELSEVNEHEVMVHLDEKPHNQEALQTLSVDQLRKQAIREMSLPSTNVLTEGTRVCAYWSRQNRCLYPGKVIKIISGNSISCTGSPANTRQDLVQVEFDDGDKGRIELDDIRLLPQDFPIQSLDYSSALGLSNEGVNENIRDCLNESNEEPSRKRKKGRKHKHHHHTKKHKNHKAKKHHNHENSFSDTEVDESSSYESNQSNSENEWDDDLSQSKSNEWVCEVKTGPVRKLRRSPPCRAVIRRKRAKPVKRSEKKAKKARSGKTLVLERDLWKWEGEPIKIYRTKNRCRKVYYKAVKRGNELLNVNDSAVFLSAGRPSLPFVGRIHSMWQIPSGTRYVRVRWYYHPEETRPKPTLLDNRGALFESEHYDNNDVQTIAHKCSVVPFPEYEKLKAEARERGEDENANKYFYISGLYKPLSGEIIMDSKVPT